MPTTVGRPGAVLAQAGAPEHAHGRPSAESLSEQSIAGALPLVLSLCRALGARGVAYCHWKSNDALDRSLSGENDLDLLVRASDSEPFFEEVARLGFKRAVTAPQKRLPGVVDLYGHDASAGRLVHLHAHFQLVVGQDHTKSYHLPFEDAYLRSDRSGCLLPVPPAELEYVVFVLRMVVKHATWETLLIGAGRLSRAEGRELAHHHDRVDRDALPSVLAAHLPGLSFTDFCRCENAIAPDSSARARIRAGRVVVRALAPHARRGRARDVSLLLVRRARQILSRRVLRASPQRAHPASGGAIVAVVGGDGAGKTTLVAGLHAWLRRDLAVNMLHIGKPRTSGTTRVALAAVGLGRRLGLYPHVGQADLHALSAEQPLPRGSLALMVRQACRARDRARAVDIARRAAADGAIVLTDRFPLPELTAMDSPTSRVLGDRVAALSRPARLLLAREDRAYAALGRPDVLVVLRVDPEVAVERRSGEPSDEVRRRSTAVWVVDWSSSGGYVVDASRPASDVLRDVQEIVWSHIPP